MLLLDTNALVWTMLEMPNLGPDAKRAIVSAFVEKSVAVSAMSFWEISMLSVRGRLIVHEDMRSWRQRVLRAGIAEITVDGTIAITGGELRNLHGDPADRIIIATAIVHGATLVTADRRILDWPSSLRRVDARR